MIFQFFKPKWQHANPKIRRQAYEQLDPAKGDDRAILLERLRADTDPVLRQWLLRHVTDPDLLRDIAKNDVDAMVRDAAQQRWRRLLTGVEAGLDRDQRLSLVEKCDDDATLLHVARHGVDAALRQRAMLRLGRESVYADVAVDDDDAELRLTAAQLLQTPAVMERVVKAAKNKDKRVRGVLQQRLDEVAAAAEKPAQCYRELKQLCIKLEAELAWLQTRGDDARVAERAQRVRQTWRETLLLWQQAHLADDENLVPRFQAADAALTTELARRADALERQRAQAAAYAAAEIQQSELCQRMTAAIAAARAWIDPDLEQAQALTATEDELVERWRDVSNAASNAALAAQFAQLHDELDAVRAAIPRHVRARQQLLELADTVRAAVGNAKRVSEAQAKRWQQQRAHAEGALAFALAAEVSADVERVFAELAQFVGGQREQQRASVDRFKQTVPELAKLVEAGQFKPAQALAHELQESLRSLPEAEREKLQRHADYRQYQAIMKQLSEMRDWKTWAATPIRERLRDEMTAMADALAAHVNDTAYDYTEAARQIQAARKQWADLGPGEDAQSGAVWQQFNDACNRAYAPCQQFFDRQAQARADNAASKSAVCDELEAFFAEHVAGKNPSDVDWRQVNALVRTGYQRWEAIGAVDRKAHGPLAERFRAIMDQLKRAQSEERERNGAAKEALAARAEHLVTELGDQPDAAVLNDAINKIKIIQQDWQHIGPAGKEKALWQRLRTAADQVFSRRQAQFEFQAQVQRASIAERERLCQLVTQLSQLHGVELRQARVQVQHIRAEWDALSPLARDQAKIWDKRLREACSAFDHALAALDRIEAEAARNIVVEQGLLCNRVEAALESALRGELDDTALRAAVNEQRKAWAFLAEAAEATAAALAERWAAVHDDVDRWLQAAPEARAAVANTVRARYAECAAAKAQWVLRLEVLADVESPPVAREQRMQLQLAMLADKMRGKDVEPMVAAGDLLVAWHAMGFAGAQVEPALQARFQRAADVLLGRAGSRGRG